MTAEAKKWFEAVEESQKAIKVNKGDEEVDKLAEAVKGGLQICTELLREEEDSGRSEEYSRCKQVLICSTHSMVYMRQAKNNSESQNSGTLFLPFVSKLV